MRNIASFGYVAIAVCFVSASIQPSITSEFEGFHAAIDWVLEEVGEIGTQIPGSVGPANRTSLAIDSANRPHIAFQNVETGEINYAYRDQTGSWSVENLVSYNIKGSFVALALDSNDHPVVCYFNLSMSPGSAGLSCAFFEDSGWRHDVVDDSSWSGSYVSISIDSLDRPHLAYVGTERSLVYSWLDGHAWNKTVIRTRDEGPVQWVSLDLDSNDAPHIATTSFLPEHGLWYYRLNKTKWEKEAIDPSTRPGAIFSMVLDSSDLPHLVYGDTWEKVPLYVYNDGSVWHFRHVGYEAKSLRGSFTLDSNQNPHVAYEDYDSWNLRYACVEGGLWKKEVVDAEGLVGFEPYLALDSNSIPSISYLDLTDWVLMYATRKKEIQADIDIDPHTINLGSRGKWITCYIELLGVHDPRDINASTILLMDTLSPELNPKYGFVKSEESYIVDHDGDGIYERMVKFDRQMVIEMLEPGETVTLTVTGRLFDGTDFQGTDVIRVIDRPIAQANNINNFFHPQQQTQSHEMPGCPFLAKPLRQS